MTRAAIEAGHVHAIAARYLYHVDDILRARKDAENHPGTDLPGEEQKREVNLRTAIDRVVRGASRDLRKQQELHRAGLQLAITSLKDRIELEQTFLEDLRQELQRLAAG